MLLPFFLLTLLTSCSVPTQPDRVFSPADSQSAATPISYRLLTVEDFQARTPPADIVEDIHRLNAHTRVSIRTTPGAKIQLSEVMVGNIRMTKGEFRSVQFEAVMFPAGSWWNPSVPWKRRGYVLQHEQIHFAIMQAEAKALNRRIQKNLKSFVVLTETPGEARIKLNDTLDQMLARSRERVSKLHMKFDSETSGTYAPERQKWWYEKMAVEKTP